MTNGKAIKLCAKGISAGFPMFLLKKRRYPRPKVTADVPTGSIKIAVILRVQLKRLFAIDISKPMNKEMIAARVAFTSEFQIAAIGGT